jgi:hypothetical protein
MVDEQLIPANASKLTETLPTLVTNDLVMS